MLGGFIWVSGISSSSTPQIRRYQPRHFRFQTPINSGLLWGVLVFGELHRPSATTYAQSHRRSLLMILGVAAISLSSASPKESAQWRCRRAPRIDRYGLSPDFVELAWMVASPWAAAAPSRGLFDWLFVALATAASFVSEPSPGFPIFPPTGLLQSFSHRS